MRYQFSREEIAMIAQAERMMDAGEMPFVRLNGERVMIRDEVLKDLGLTKGQTINVEIFRAIQHENIAYCEAQMAIAKALGSQRR